MPQNLRHFRSYATHIHNLAPKPKTPEENPKIIASDLKTHQNPESKIRAYKHWLPRRALFL